MGRSSSSTACLLSGRVMTLASLKSTPRKTKRERELEAAAGRPPLPPPGVPIPFLPKRKDPVLTAWTAVQGFDGAQVVRGHITPDGLVDLRGRHQASGDITITHYKDSGWGYKELVEPVTLKATRIKTTRR